MDWDKDMSLQLINEFRNKDILWNQKHTSYFNNAKKEEAWTIISKIFDVDVDELKRKMDSLRGSYRREKNRMKKRAEANKDQRGIYTSSWFAYESMKFLDNKDEAKTMMFDTIKVECDYVPETETNSPDRTSPEIKPVADEPTDIVTEPPRRRCIRPQKRRKPFLLTRKPALKRRNNSESCTIDDVPKTAGLSQRDECSVYGEHIGNKLRKLRERLRAIVQHKINNIIFEAEMEQFSTHFLVAQGTYDDAVETAPVQDSTQMSFDVSCVEMT